MLSSVVFPYLACSICYCGIPTFHPVEDNSDLPRVYI